jgi:hypothetical protein
MLRQQEIEILSPSLETEEGESDDEGQQNPVSVASAVANLLEEPAPTVVLGAEDEFVKVSHLASIEVKKVAKPSKSTSQRHSPVTANRNHQCQDKETPVGKMAPSKRSQTNQEQKMSKETGTDSEPISASSAMEIIVKSPYEPGSHAEKGETIFEDMQNVLKGVEDRPSQSAITMFGMRNALCLLRANALIDISGMVYSQEWSNGNIRGITVGKIPSELLLLCLVPQRFAKTNELLLSGLCRDMKIYDLVNKAIDEWGVQEEYKLVCFCF